MVQMQVLSSIPAGREILLPLFVVLPEVTRGIVKHVEIT